MNNPLESRVIRIFISSTFKDMDVERNYLSKIFRSLQIESLNRDVTLRHLDLRWGITEKQKKSGKVLEVCLREIENSHPFFIGIVGDRYGWCPTNDELKKNEYLRERYDWIAKDIDDGLSVTEMEMQYGVLRNPENMNAFFYIKKDGHCDDNPEKLERLKAAIRANHRYPVYDYTTAEEIGEQVTKDFIALLDKLYPQVSLSQLEKDRLAQKSFMRSRCDVYIPNESNYRHLDEWFASGEPALVVTGPSGMGKSALIANWLTERKQTLGKVIYHFVGNGGLEGSYGAIAQRLCREIQDLYSLDEPTEEFIKKGQEGKLNDLIGQIVGKDPLLIVLDGVNQLADIDNAKLLNWLPFPTANVRFLFSTLIDDQTMTVFERRGYQQFILEPLQIERRKLLAVAYLELISKKLDDNLIDVIIKDKECENTLVLKILLDEMASFGCHEKLAERIRYYTSANSIEEFFQRVLVRYEEDYSDNSVIMFLSLIAFSRNGLSEQELIDITKAKHFDWSLVYCAMAMHLTNRNGLVTFSHQYMRNAAIARYAELESNARAEIVRYFGDRKDSRACDELPYQYFTIGDHKMLHKYIVDFEVFDYVYTEDEFGLAKYWRYLLDVDKESYKLSDYLLVESQSAVVEVYNKLALFIQDNFFDYSIALTYLKKSLLLYDPDNFVCDLYVAIIYNNIGRLYADMNNLDAALEYYKNALEIWKSEYTEEDMEVVAIYNNIADVYTRKYNFRKAYSYYDKALRLLLPYGDNEEYKSMLLNNLGMAYLKNSEYKKAEDYFAKSVDIIIAKFGENHPYVAAAYNNIGLNYSEQKDDKAILYFKRSLRILESLYGLNNLNLVSIYNNLGGAYENKMEYTEAFNCYAKSVEIGENFCGMQHALIGPIYSNIANIYLHNSEYDKALEYYTKDLEITCSILNQNNPDVAAIYNNMSNVYFKQKIFDRALEYLFKSLEIYKCFFDDHNSAVINEYSNIAECYEAMGEDAKAAEYRAYVQGDSSGCNSNSSNNQMKLGVLLRKFWNFIIQKKE